MRHNIDEMLHEVTTRSEELRDKHDRNVMRALSGLSLAMVMTLVSVVSVLSENVGTNSIHSVYGSFLIAEAAGGYVIVALIAFISGVLITHVAQKYRDRKKRTIS